MYTHIHTSHNKHTPHSHTHTHIVTSTHCKFNFSFCFVVRFDNFNDLQKNNIE